jgi:hypothetical protein
VISVDFLRSLDVVRLGEHDLKDDREGAKPEDFRAEKITVHPGYSPPALYNDIAAVK